MSGISRAYVKKRISKGLSPSLWAYLAKEGLLAALVTDYSCYMCLLRKRRM